MTYSIEVIFFFVAFLAFLLVCSCYGRIPAWKEWMFSSILFLWNMFTLANCSLSRTIGDLDHCVRIYCTYTVWISTISYFLLNIMKEKVALSMNIYHKIVATTTIFFTIHMTALVIPKTMHNYTTQFRKEANANMKHGYPTNPFQPGGMVVPYYSLSPFQLSPDSRQLKDLLEQLKAERYINPSTYIEVTLRMGNDTADIVSIFGIGPTPRKRIEDYINNWDYIGQKPSNPFIVRFNIDRSANIINPYVENKEYTFNLLVK